MPCLGGAFDSIIESNRQIGFMHGLDPLSRLLAISNDLVELDYVREVQSPTTVPIVVVQRPNFVLSSHAEENLKLVYSLYELAYDSIFEQVRKMNLDKSNYLSVVMTGAIEHSFFDKYWFTPVYGIVPKDMVVGDVLTLPHLVRNDPFKFDSMCFYNSNSISDILSRMFSDIQERVLRPVDLSSFKLGPFAGGFMIRRLSSR